MARQYSASDLRKQIELLVKTRTPDGGGGVTEAYASASPPIKVRALVEPMSASERFYAQQIASQERTLVVIRYRPDVKQDMRVAYNHREFHITSVIDVEERHTWLELICEERQAG